VQVLQLGQRLHWGLHLLTVAMANFLKPLLLDQRSPLRVRLWIRLQFQMQLQF
jgi:hypothetical protein